MESPNSFHIYLNSNENLNEFPENNPNEFTNILRPPINLIGEYEISLENIIFRPEFYLIQRFDESYSINIHVEYANSKGNISGFSLKYMPENDIQVTNMVELIKYFDRNFKEFLLRQSISFNTTKPIFQYENADSFVKFNEIELDETEYTFYNINWRITPKLCTLFGFQSETFINTPIVTKPPKYPNVIETMMIYCDIITPTNYANQNIHLLDIIPMENMFSKNSTMMIYKTVNRVES